MTDLLQLAAALVVAALSGGGGGAVIVKWIDRRAQGEESEIGRLRADIATAKEQHAECERTLEDLANRLEIVERHHASAMPRWILSADKRFEWVNDPAMLQVFARLGLTREQVIGRTVLAVFDGQAARELDRLERAALAAPGTPAASQVTLRPGMPAMLVAVTVAMGRLSEWIYEVIALQAPAPSVVDQRAGERAREQMGATRVHLDGDDAAAAE